MLKTKTKTSLRSLIINHSDGPPLDPRIPCGIPNALGMWPLSTLTHNALHGHPLSRGSPLLYDRHLLASKPLLPTSPQLEGRRTPKMEVIPPKAVFLGTTVLQG